MSEGINMQTRQKEREEATPSEHPSITMARTEPTAPLTLAHAGHGLACLFVCLFVNMLPNLILKKSIKTW